MDSFESLSASAERALARPFAYPGFTPPIQTRTVTHTRRIIAATTLLLQQRDYDQISIQDIAALADCAVTSIYARFQSKDAILPAVHLLTLEHHRPILAEELSPLKFRGADLMDFSTTFVEANHTYFLRNKFFIEAASRHASAIIYHQFSHVLDDYSSRIANTLEDLANPPAGPLIPSCRFAISQVIAYYRSETAFGADLSNVPTAGLARLFAMIIREGLTA